jgi:hypothetical protein
MVIKYVLEHQRNNIGRNRHALYHFYNTNNNINRPVVTISPDIYYANQILKGNRRFTPNNVKLTRMRILSGGNLKKAATIIKRSVRNRYKNIEHNLNPGRNRVNYKNLTNNNIRPTRHRNTHWLQFKHYANLERILGKTRTNNVYRQGNRRLSQLSSNQNIIPKYNNLYRRYTRGILYPPSVNVNNRTLYGQSKRLQRTNPTQYSRLRYGNIAGLINSIRRDINRLTRG